MGSLSSRPQPGLGSGLYDLSPGFSLPLEKLGQAPGLGGRGPGSALLPHRLRVPSAFPRVWEPSPAGSLRDLLPA